ncbi:hypothetical protein DERF_013705 [Dermatophagoides farinae]|uniref:Uncharacterized protein n=1 Tax=Dermatophagoides farinae TaxID=6954 RepID=A0A922KWV4_DERFA|nr:hypothetical protein DERF_013705 [Dermatophagoides farinae]
MKPSSMEMESSSTTESPSSLIMAESRHIPVQRRRRRRKMTTATTTTTKNYGKKKKRKVYKIHHHHHPNHYPMERSPLLYHDRHPMINGNYPPSSRKKSIFIPVALYSVTKKLPKNIAPKMSASNVSIRRKQINPNHHYDNLDNPNIDDDHSNNDDYEMRKESAVYGYIEKPEIIEFKGQYYYGSSGDGGDNIGEGSDDNNSGTNGDNDEYSMDDHRHYQRQYDEDQLQPSYVPSSQEHYSDYHPHDYHHDLHYHHDYIPSSYPMTASPMYHHHHDSYDNEPSLTALLVAKLKKILLVKGITAKGLLLASIPFLLSPLLSYMLTPVVIPITATVAAGRRRKRDLHQRPIWKMIPNSMDDINNHQDIEIILKFLQPIFETNELWLNKAIANFLHTDGFFSTDDQCFEQLACQILNAKNYKDDPNSTMVTMNKYLNPKYIAASIFLDHLLRNEFVSEKFKKRIYNVVHYDERNNNHHHHIIIDGNNVQSI